MMGPTGGGATATALLDFAALLTNKDELQKRIADLANQEQAAKNAAAEASALMATAAERDRASAGREKATLEGKSELDARIAAHIQDRAQHEALHQERVSAVGEREMALNTRMAEAERREREVSAREAAIGERERDASAKMAHAQALKTDYETRLSKLKAAME